MPQANSTSHKTPAPPSPKPPGVNQSAWEKSVEQKKLRDLSVHDVGVIVFNESKSYSDARNSNEPIGTAREKMAHTIMNGDREYGANRQRAAGTALPVEPSDKALSNPAIRAAYNSSMRAAREAYLSGSDPTQGALHLNARGDAGRGNWKPKDMAPPGKPLRTQSGPYNNAYTKGDTPYSKVWLNTYGP